MPLCYEPKFCHFKNTTDYFFQTQLTVCISNMIKSQKTPTNCQNKIIPITYILIFVQQSI